MKAFTVAERGAGPTISEGVQITDGRHIYVGNGLGARGFGGRVVLVPLSTELVEEIAGAGRLTSASVMRSSTNVMILAKENREQDREGRVLVLIDVNPGEGLTTVITRAQMNVHKCPYRNWTDEAAKTCQECGTAYVEKKGEAGFIHPQFGFQKFYSEHLSSEVVEVGEGHYGSDDGKSHRVLLLVVEVGARIRIARLDASGHELQSWVLVRTATELDFALPGEIHLASELTESVASYL